MDEFRKLREAAAAKRDGAINRAKAEHAKTVQKIAELEDRIRGKRRPRPNARPKTTLADTIYSVLPDDRTFTIDDVCGLVKSAEPERERSRASINTNVNRMLHAGTLKRVSYAKAGKPAVFAMMTCVATEARTMLDWAREIDGHRDMPAVELMVAMVEAGYEMASPPAETVKSLTRELQKSKQLQL